MSGGLDLTLTLSNLIEIGLIVGGGIAAFAVMKVTVAALRTDVSDGRRETSESFDEIRENTKEQFAAVQAEIKKIGEVLVNQADQNRRIIHLEEDVRELRHGRGFVRGDGGIEREYPA